MMLDKKDRKILSELDANARQPNTQLAKKANLSKDATGYRIKRLESKGIITGYRTLIDVRKIGYVQYRVALELIDINSQAMAELLTFLKQEKSVWAIGKNEGEWDIAFVHVSRNVVDFYLFLELFMEKFKRLVKNKLITELLKYDEIGRNYLVKEKSMAYKKISIDAQTMSVDKTDLAILNLLSKNARWKLIKIAQELNTSSMLIHQRIKKLEKKGIILGYKATINVLALDRDYYGIKINLKDYSEKEKLLAHVYALEESSAVIYALGGYDVEFDVELTGTKAYHALIDSLRNKFFTIREIKSIRTIDYWVGEQKLS